MDSLNVLTVDGVQLNRRGSTINGTLILAPYHLVFTFVLPSTTASTTTTTSSTPVTREIWICYPVVERISRARGSTWLVNNPNSSDSTPKVDHYSSSHIRLQCKDFTYYSFDFANDAVCTEVFNTLSALVALPLFNIKSFYAFHYNPNTLEQKLSASGWDIYDPLKEYKRQGLLTAPWRVSHINTDYKFCPSYPEILVVPSSISDNVVKHAGKFRSKQRIPAIVYKHRGSANGNVIARCSQPLVGLNLQNRSIQDEKLISEIFRSQERERADTLPEEDELHSQPHRNLLVDLRPITNAMAQHALGAGTENIDNYRGRPGEDDEQDQTPRLVDKIFCNIDNIHVMRESLNKLTTVLNDLDKYPTSIDYPLLQQALTKTQWLHRLSIVLQSVDRITKSVHLNNTNVIIHCSDGWDRTSQVSALAQLCLDPYYRTTKGFMILIEKEWVSFGFKFATRGDHGGCIGAKVHKKPIENSTESPEIESPVPSKVTSFLQRAAYHIKNTASGSPSHADGEENGKFLGSKTYSENSEKSPIFHQFLDCVFQLFRQHPSKFEFNSRFLKRLFYHYYSCQYGTFLCDCERERRESNVAKSTTSVWDYFNSRPTEFSNNLYQPDDGVLFFNYTDIKWWFELYGRTDEEMNGLSNSLDRKFAQMKLAREEAQQ